MAPDKFSVLYTCSVLEDFGIAGFDAVDKLASLATDKGGLHLSELDTIDFQTGTTAKVEAIRSPRLQPPEQDVSKTSTAEGEYTQHFPQGVFALTVQRDDDGDGRRSDLEESERTMNRFGNVLKSKVLGGVLVAAMVVPAVAGLPLLAQSRGGYGAPQYQQTDYRNGYYGGNGYRGNNGYNGGYDRGGYNLHRGVGPGTGALIGAGAGALLGGLLGGGKGALIGGGAGAAVGAVAGKANQDSHRGYGYNNGAWNNGYNGYGYSNGYGYRR